MTTPQPPSFTVTADTGATQAVVRIAGDLDYETCERLVRAVDSVLGDPAAVPESQPASLRLDFAGLRSIDSMGLSALLTIRRRTDARRVRLHLDERPAVLERLLELTGTCGYLTAPPDEQDEDLDAAVGRPGS